MISNLNNNLLRFYLLINNFILQYEILYERFLSIHNIFIFL